MSGPAKVTSIDVLQTLATALQRFRCEATAAMEGVDLETQRAMDWMQYDCKQYWAREARRSEEAIAQARLQLKQARSARKVADHEPICVIEERALKRALHRQETVRQKIEAVARWTRDLDAAINHVQRKRIQFLCWLDSDIPKGIAALNRMSASLESYISLETPADPGILAVEQKAPSVDSNALPLGGVTKTCDAGTAEPVQPAVQPVPTPQPDAERHDSREETRT
jgi:hypothetical protein